MNIQNNIFAEIVCFCVGARKWRALIGGDDFLTVERPCGPISLQARRFLRQSERALSLNKRNIHELGRNSAQIFQLIQNEFKTLLNIQFSIQYEFSTRVNFSVNSK